jgi:hypothetical protein
VPISFEPMGPGNVEQIAQAYGASLAAQANREFALKAQGQAQDYSLRSAALAQQNSHFQDELASRTNLQSSAQSHQEVMAQLQGQLDSNKLSQAEEIRRQRLQSQVDYVRSNTGEGRQFSAEDGQNMIAKLTTDLDPLERQRTRQQMLQSEAQTRLVMHQDAAAVTREDTHRRFLGRDGPLQHTDANGISWVQTAPERWERVKPETPEITPQIRARFATIARSEQEREVRDAQRAGTLPPAWAANTPEGIAARDLDRQRRVNEMVRDHSGGGGPTRGDAATDHAAFVNDVLRIVQGLRQPRQQGGPPAANPAIPASPAGYQGPTMTTDQSSESYASPYGQ